MHHGSTSLSSLLCRARVKVRRRRSPSDHCADLLATEPDLRLLLLHPLSFRVICGIQRSITHLRTYLQNSVSDGNTAIDVAETVISDMLAVGPLQPGIFIATMESMRSALSDASGASLLPEAPADVLTWPRRARRGRHALVFHPLRDARSYLSAPRQDNRGSAATQGLDFRR